MGKITRRNVLALGGAAAIGATVGGFGVATALRQSNSAGGPPARQARVSFDSWTASRRPPYYIAHRGAGAVVPEHTMPSYQAALDWGAQALEMSVVLSADRVPYCLHDLTLDRTTTLTGPAGARTSEELDRARVQISRLGPMWAGPRMPAIPRLAAVLETVAGRAVLCIEAKDDAAYPLLIQAVKDAGVEDALMVKLDARSPRLAEAKMAGYPVFAYLGNSEEATAPGIDALAKRLDPDRDALVLPARAGTGIFSSDLVRRAVETGLPVWIYPVHRRSEGRYFTRLGVEGLITPNIGYLTGTVPPQTRDNWASGGLAPGELTRDPYSDAYGLTWGEEGVVALAAQGRQAFLTLGQLSPIVADSYRLTLDVSFDPLPSDSWQNISIAFGHADDRYYEHRLGDADGNHVLVRVGGSMGIYTHVEGDPNGQLLAESQSGAPLKQGTWSRLTLDVTADTIRWSRDDGTVLEARDSRFRGGYLHVGRSSDDGQLKLRNLTIS